MGVDLSGDLPQLLADKGWTQDELARRTKIKRTDINKIANGFPVGKNRHQRIVKALGLTVADVPGRPMGQPREPSLSDRLRSLEAVVDSQGLSMTQALDALAKEVRALNKWRASVGSPAKRKTG